MLGKSHFYHEQLKEQYQFLVQCSMRLIFKEIIRLELKHKI